jgi:hypothetical protein
LTPGIGSPDWLKGSVLSTLGASGRVAGSGSIAGASSPSSVPAVFFC